MVEAIKRQTLKFEMPGAGIPDFAQHSKAIAGAGIYDLALHHDLILKPVILGHWDIANRRGLTPSAAAARDRLVQFITRIGKAAARIKAPRAETAVAARTMKRVSSLTRGVLPPSGSGARPACR